MEIMRSFEIPDKIEHPLVVQVFNEPESAYVILFCLKECSVALKYLLLRNYENVFLWEVVNGILARRKDISNNIEILEKPELNNLWK